MLTVLVLFMVLLLLRCVMLLYCAGAYEKIVLLIYSAAAFVRDMLPLFGVGLGQVFLMFQIVPLSLGNLDCNILRGHSTDSPRELHDHFLMMS